MSDLFRYLQTALSDRYQLERELGRGGMATVYLARELKHPRRVAIKVLRPELVGVLARERFLREIRISSEFTHPHILPLLDSGTVPASPDYPALPLYTMPYVEGESLRDRLKREKQLPVDDALQVARDVAAALGYAHAHGVIHRDIKPENILLTGGQAVVADFGIARAIQEAVDPDALTSAGLVIGTPPYMSPEQAGGETNLDGRSDLYSLGCVLYEMLGGEPPFTGSSVQAVLARHRLDQAPSLRTIRGTVPEAVEQVVMRTLQKSPADRYATAEQFVEALTAGASGEMRTSPARPYWLHGRSLLIGLLLAIGAGTAWYLATGAAANARADLGSGAVDTTRYAILSFDQDSSVPEGLHPALLLQDAMARWGGISPVDPFQVRDVVTRHDTAGFVDADWRRLARELGAGRYVRAGASRVGDSIRVHAVLYDASTRRDLPALREETVRLPLDLAGADSVFETLADGLLLRHPGTSGHQPAGVTTSLPARQAFELGSEALTQWDLSTADSSFSEAARHDPEYAQAHLWVALVRSWSDPDAPSAWQSAAERAAALREQLSARDRQISDAVLSSARGAAAQSCVPWEKLTKENPQDFVVWYGLATCLQRDHVVVRDRGSPTGWRFRSSYHAAINSFQRAYALLPSIHQAFREAAYASVVNLLMASGTDLRGGRALPPDSTSFFASPSWAGDSLVLYPVPALPGGGAPSTATPTTEDAVRHQRGRVYDFARAWVAAYPASADAMQALAVSLQVLGDRSALDTIVRARRLAHEPAQVVRVATTEVFMRVVYSAPSGLNDLREARRLADSLLLHTESVAPPAPQLLASMAALVGRADRAAALARQVPSTQAWETPPALTGAASGFLTYAAMGGPADSLRRLARLIATAIDRDVLEDDRAEARALWLGLPVAISFPSVQLPEVASLDDPGSGLVAAEAAFARGDAQAARSLMAAYWAQGPASDRSVSTIDQLFPAAWLEAALGDSAAAAARLDRALEDLPRSFPQLYGEVFRTGPLVRAMALRAELADRAGDRPTARRWAQAVVALWSGADAFLQPTVRRMEGLAR